MGYDVREYYTRKKETGRGRGREGEGERGGVEGEGGREGERGGGKRKRRREGERGGGEGGENRSPHFWLFAKTQWRAPKGSKPWGRAASSPETTRETRDRDCSDQWMRKENLEGIQDLACQKKINWKILLHITHPKEETRRAVCTHLTP